MLLKEHDRRAFLKDLQRPDLDSFRRSQIRKRINRQCRKINACPYCDSINGQIRKISPIKLVHDKFSSYNKSNSATKVPPESKIKFDASFTEVQQENPDIKMHLSKAIEDLNPL